MIYKIRIALNMYIVEAETRDEAMNKIIKFMIKNGSLKLYKIYKLK